MYYNNCMGNPASKCKLCFIRRVRENQVKKAAEREAQLSREVVYEFIKNKPTNPEVNRVYPGFLFAGDMPA